MNNERLLEDLEQLCKRTVGEKEHKLIDAAILTIRQLEAELNKVKFALNTRN